MTRDQTGGLPLSIRCTAQLRLRFRRRHPPGRSEDPLGTFSWGGIYYTDFWVDPKHELIGIMMTQIYPSGHLKLRDDFHRLVNGAIKP